MEILKHNFMLIRNLIHSLRNLTRHLLQINNHLCCVFTVSCCWMKQWRPNYCTDLHIPTLLPNPGKVFTPPCKHSPKVSNLFLSRSLNHIPLVSATYVCWNNVNTTASDTRASSDFSTMCKKHSPPVSFRELTKVDILSFSTSVKSRIPKDW
jgi:hypothetical protein